MTLGGRPRFLNLKRIVMASVVVAAVWIAAKSASFLVVNAPERSDAIIVLAGDSQDYRYWTALRLLRAGMASQMFYNARYESRDFGHTPAEYAAAFVRESAGADRDRIHICPTRGSSTRDELLSARRCLASAQLHSVLLVTSDYHTRRALSIAQHVMPQYHWSVAASNDPYQFGSNWWQHREWAKTNLFEWQRLIWWELVDRWRSVSPR